MRNTLKMTLAALALIPAAVAAHEVPAPRTPAR